MRGLGYLNEVNRLLVIIDAAATATAAAAQGGYLNTAGVGKNRAAPAPTRSKQRRKDQGGWVDISQAISGQGSSHCRRLGTTVVFYRIMLSLTTQM